MRFNDAVPLRQSDRSELLKAAREIGDRLDSLAWWRGEQATWVGPALLHEQGWYITALSHDLYNGLPGVSLFLAYLGAMSAETKYTGLARAAVETFSYLVPRRRAVLKNVGAFHGWGGLVYVYTHLGILWDDPVLLAKAESCVEELLPLIDDDEILDVMGGSAGCIGALLALHRSTSSQLALEAAVRCGERLVSRASDTKAGVGWYTAHSQTEAWAGLSHGNAGISWALLELAAEVGDPRFKQKALAAIEYERTLLDANLGTWVDLRIPEEERNSAVKNGRPYLAAWCNGAPGIGLARLRSLDYLGTDAHREVEIALHTTLRDGFGESHCLCHGDLGNAELLLEASRRSWPGVREPLDQLGRLILDSIGCDGWRCGALPSRLEMPGLMVGLAGIGYGLLRLYDPLRVPSVLMLDPPATVST
jgi:type 2 lantibiotic biosynthesis protein LanM